MVRSLPATIACLGSAWGRLAQVWGCLLLGAMPAFATEIQNLCHVKGQEPIKLTGYGLVAGLNGTGDSRLTPAQRAIAQTLGLFGGPITNLRDVEQVRNMALVMVTCEIPGVGGREGDRFPCRVVSVGNAKSLAGGLLLRTVLQGPRVDDNTAYAFAEGPLQLDNVLFANHALVPDGAKLNFDLYAPFECGDFITLVIDNAHAGFPTANVISGRINDSFQPQLSASGRFVRIAQAQDAKNIIVQVPDFAKDDVVKFVATIMRTTLPTEFVHTEARVIINRKKRTIIVTGEVELTPVLVAQANLIIFPVGAAAVGQAVTANDFVALTPAPLPVAPGQPVPPALANLNDLLLALNRAQVSEADKIAIIEELAKSGKLHAQVLYE